MEPTPTKIKKADVTRERLFKVAMQMIAKDGFDATTMRAIATKAEVAPGAIYYHFDSKESLIQEYYRQSHEDHLALLADELKSVVDFEQRLHRVITTKIQVALPYKDMAVALFRIAANPQSPLSPFSEPSRELRVASVELFREVVAGAKDKFHPEIRKFLPEYLWLYQMGVILFWIYDRSPKSEKTFQFIDKTVPLIASLNAQLQSPWAAPFRGKVISLLKSFQPDLD
jgi:AcrR family transcriptional regulator